MKIILVDTHRKALMPLSLTRPTAHILIGMDRIADKWQRYTGAAPRVLTASYIAEGLADCKPPTAGEEYLWVGTGVLPSTELLEEMRKLEAGQVLTSDGWPVAGRAKSESPRLSVLRDKLEAEENILPEDLGTDMVEYPHEIETIRRPADIFALNDTVLRRDFAEITGNHSPSGGTGAAQTMGNQLYVSEGAKLNPCILNAEVGPIYIGKNAEVMEGSVIRGPFFLGEGSAVKMGAKIYGATSVGRHCKVGGEVNNAVIHDFSNKGHDGFLGNSVLGSWCNLGADTNTSNLKNNYGEVSVWSYETDRSEPTGMQFHGLVMGDHSKTSINTMLNTGTVIGVSTNVFGGGFPPKFVPSFQWGSPDGGFTEYRMDKAEAVARAVMARRSVEFSDADRAVFAHIARRARRYAQ